MVFPTLIPMCTHSFVCSDKLLGGMHTGKVYPPFQATDPPFQATAPGIFLN